MQNDRTDPTDAAEDAHDDALPEQPCGTDDLESYEILHPKGCIVEVDCTHPDAPCLVEESAEGLLDVSTTEQPLPAAVDQLALTGAETAWLVWAGSVLFVVGVLIAVAAYFQRKAGR